MVNTTVLDDALLQFEVQLGYASVTKYALGMHSSSLKKLLTEPITLSQSLD